MAERRERQREEGHPRLDWHDSAHLRFVHARSGGGAQQSSIILRLLLERVDICIWCAEFKTSSVLYYSCMFVSPTLSLFPVPPKYDLSRRLYGPIRDAMRVRPRQSNRACMMCACLEQKRFPFISCDGFHHIKSQHLTNPFEYHLAPATSTHRRKLKALCACWDGIGNRRRI